MGRKPLPAHLRASVSKHVNLHPNEDKWLQEKGFNFTEFVRTKICEAMNNDHDFERMQLVNDYNRAKSEMEEIGAKFESKFGCQIDDECKMKLESSDDPDKERYLLLWKFLSKYRPDICTTILGDGSGTDAVPQQMMIEAISAQLRDKAIIDPPRTALDKLGRYSKEGVWSL